MDSMLICMLVVTCMSLCVLHCDPTKADADHANEFMTAIDVPEHSDRDLETMNKATDKLKHDSIKDAMLVQKIYSAQCPAECRCYTDGKSISFTTNCSNSGLVTVPANISEATTHLLLDNNEISVLSNYSFRRLKKLLFLDISDNQLQNVSALSFEGLSKLQYLSLAGNLLYSVDAYPVEVFRPLLMLKTLHMQRNCNYQKIQQGCSYHSEVFNPLSNLRSLFMDGITTQKPGPGFESLKSPKVLRMGERSLPFCQIGNLSLSWIENLRQCPLKHISMPNCHIDNTEPMVLASFKTLESLDLNDNDRLCNNSWSPLKNLLTGLNNTKIKSLNLSKTCNHNNRLLSDAFAPLTDTKLEKLAMRHSFIENVDAQLIDVLPQSLRYLDMSDNVVGNTKFLEVIHNLNNLEFIDMSNQFKYHSTRTTDNDTLQFNINNAAFGDRVNKCIDTMTLDEEETELWLNRVEYEAQQNFGKFKQPIVLPPKLRVALAGNMSPGVRKPTIWILTRSDVNQAAQQLKMARGWKFWI